MKRIYPSMQIKRMQNPGVRQVAEKLAKRQADGWMGDKSIHPSRRHIRVHVEAI